MRLWKLLSFSKIPNFSLLWMPNVMWFLSNCTQFYFLHITSQPGSGYSSGVGTGSSLNPCCFQGSCLTLQDAFFHLSMHSLVVFTEGNQSEIQQSRLISIMKGCGEYAITQPGCLAALCAANDRRGKSKWKVHASEGHGEITGDSHLKGGNEDRPQLKLSRACMPGDQSSWKLPGWWPHGHIPDLMAQRAL